METQPLDETKIALINNNISYIQKDIADIKTSVKELAGVYITRTQFDAAMKERDEKITDLLKQSGLWKWLSPTLAAVTGSVLTFLILSYLQHLK